MKRILVYDIAAEKGGAKTVLDEWYQNLLNDKDNHYLLVTSVLDYERAENIDVLKLKWVKKSWLHRLFCDYFYIKKIIAKKKIDEIISLQNTCIPNVKIKQTVYIHNAIPFSNCDFNIFLEPVLWLNKHIIGKKVRESAKKADKVIVQTNWMKQTIHEQLNISTSSIQVMPVRVWIKQSSIDSKINRNNHFFYPATPLSFKNHQVILDACDILKREGISDFSISFTFNESDNSLAKKIGIYIKRHDLPINLIGILDKDQMEIYYQDSILIFPSKLETVGLPILEAQAYNSIELLAEEPYSKEIIKDYKNVRWFGTDNALELAVAMKSCLEIIRNENNYAEQ